MPLIEKDSTLLLPSIDGKQRKTSNKSNTNGFEPVVLPAFDLSTKKIGH